MLERKHYTSFRINGGVHSLLISCFILRLSQVDCQIYDEDVGAFKNMSTHRLLFFYCCRMFFYIHILRIFDF